MFDILPVVGSGTVLVPWAVISMLTGNVGRGVGLIIVWVIISVIRQIIEPKIVGDTVGMHPLLTLFAMLFGNFVYGGLGIFLVPITIALLSEPPGAGHYTSLQDCAGRRESG